MALTTYNITGNLEDALGAKATLGEVTFMPAGTTEDARVDGADAMLGPIRYSFADLPSPMPLTEGAWVITIRSTGRVNGDAQFRTKTIPWNMTAATTWGAIVASAAAPVPLPAPTFDESVAGVLGTGGQTDAALEATFGTVYRPEQYGAVGDGVADDTAAFVDMCAAINAAPTIPAKVEITGIHRIPAPPAGINFDVENIEVYLAAGSHVFSEAASASGGLLSFVGHYGLGTATTPRRGSVKVHGPGKVTGWVGGTNENAIGIVRYERAIVDGPYVNAGNKGVTAQIGVPYATVRNIRSDQALRVVSIEDQAGAVRTTIENIRFDSCVEHAVLVSAAWASVRAVVGNQAWTSGGSSAGAVHVTTASTLTWAQVEDVEVGNAGAAKGVVISQAQDFHVGNVRVGESGGNAVDIFNCPNGGTVGVVTSPSSPAGAVATGTTPVARLRRIHADRNVLVSGEATMTRLSVNTTSLSLPTGTMRLGYFEATKTETISRVRIISGGATPTGVTLMRVGVYEVDDATGDLTLVASTPNDTTYPTATNTAYTKTLSASFRKRAGVRYAVGLLGVFTGGALQVPGVSVVGAIGSEAAQAPRLSAAVSGLADLPASQAVTAANDTAAMPYFVLVP